MAHSISCKACGSKNVHHSRLRGWVENLRWRLSSAAPFRCHDCQWRGWMPDSGMPSGSGSEPVIRAVHKSLTEEELDRMDPREH